MSAPDSNSVRETPGHSVTSAPDWPAVKEAVAFYERWADEDSPQLYQVVRAAEWALAHGPAIEAAETVWWCEEHNMHVRWSDAITCAQGGVERDPNCRMVKRRLLPGEDE